MRFLPILAAVAPIIAPLCCATPAPAQKEEVIAFFGGGRGSYPQARLLKDRNGNLYGTAELGGLAGDKFGTAFELVNGLGRWSDVTLYNFDLLSGGFPEAGLISDPHSLFGTTALGGDDGCGMVFRLTLDGGRWRETVLHGFSYNNDGCVPVSELVMDAAGTLYGSTGIGGTNGYGTIFQLTRSGKTWSYSIVYNFGGTDGYNPQGILLGPDGTIYGTTSEGGSSSAGTVFALAQSGGVWSETVLHSFGGTGDGNVPSGGLAMDAAGNLYGSTMAGGANNAGSVYALSPSGQTWTESVLYSFTGGADGDTPIDGIALHDGALYGATTAGGSAGGGGTVFTLTRKGATWTETVLHSFPQPGGEDGSEPAAHPIVSARGEIFGTTLYGGKNNKGTAYRIVR